MKVDRKAQRAAAEARRATNREDWALRRSDPVEWERRLRARIAAVAPGRDGSPTRAELRAASCAAWALRAGPHPLSRRELPADFEQHVAAAIRTLEGRLKGRRARRPARALAHRHEQLRRDHHEEVLAVWSGAEAGRAVLLVDGDDPWTRGLLDPGGDDGGGVALGTLPVEDLAAFLARAGIDPRAAAAASQALAPGELRVVVLAAGVASVSAERVG